MIVPDAVGNPDFEFAIKANQVFTHAAGTKPSERKTPTSVESLKYTREDVDETRRFLDVLAERDRLLVVLFQFPVSFKFASKDKQGEPVRLEGNWDHVADVLNAFRQYSKAMEFRHESWDDPWVLSALREHETAWVNIDEHGIFRSPSLRACSTPLRNSFESTEVGIYDEKPTAYH